MTKFLISIFIFLSLVTYSQIGGRLKEISNQRILKRHIFRTGWPDRKWVPNKLNHIEPDRKLFHRHTTYNQRFKEKVLKKINRDRTRRRMRNRNSFSKRKYR